MGQLGASGFSEGGFFRIGAVVASTRQQLHREPQPAADEHTRRAPPGHGEHERLRRVRLAVATPSLHERRETLLGDFFRERAVPCPRRAVAEQPGGQVTNGFFEVHVNVVPRRGFQSQVYPPGTTAGVFPADLSILPDGSCLRASQASAPGAAAASAGRLSRAASRERLRARNRLGPLLDKGIFGFQPREPTEVAICRQQPPDAVVEAQSRNSRIVDGPSNECCVAQEAIPDSQETFCFTQQHKRGRLKPVADLSERLPEGGGRIIDARVCDDSQKLVHTGPRDGPGRNPFGQGRHGPIGLQVPGRVGAMGLDEDVGVDRDQLSPRPVDQVPHLVPVPFGDAGLQSLTFEWATLQLEGAPGLILGEAQPQGLLDHLAERLVLESGLPFCLFEQVVGNTDGRLHMANHTRHRRALSTAAQAQRKPSMARISPWRGAGSGAQGRRNRRRGKPDRAGFTLRWRGPG